MLLTVNEAYGMVVLVVIVVVVVLDDVLVAFPTYMLGGLGVVMRGWVYKWVEHVL